MHRDDVSNKLIHFTKGTDQEAADIFLKIVRESRLLGGTGYIKGCHHCVCFTEAPVAKLAHIFSDRIHLNVPYAPFGVMVDKTWLWNKGGRPVIYQSDREYELLHQSHQYRHKRYEPDKGIDFTWEREWRILATEVTLDPKESTLIVPDRSWVDRLHREHTESVRGNVWAAGDDGCFFVEPYQWHFIALSDLGISL